MSWVVKSFYEIQTLRIGDENEREILLSPSTTAKIWKYFHKIFLFSRSLFLFSSFPLAPHTSPPPRFNLWRFYFCANFYHCRMMFLSATFRVSQKTFFFLLQILFNIQVLSRWNHPVGDTECRWDEDERNKIRKVVSSHFSQQLSQLPSSAHIHSIRAVAHRIIFHFFTFLFSF